MREKRGEERLSDLGEDRLLARMIGQLPEAAGVVVGPGDDCAVLRLGGAKWLWTTDSLIAGTHFLPAWMKPRQIGRKAYLVNASDIAAMGGQPTHCLVSIAAPPTLAARELIDIEKGIATAARRDGAAVVGGNVSRGADLSVTISLLGRSPRIPLLRSGACAGDALYVSGSLGGAALGLEQLRRDASARGAAVKRFREPRPRLSLGSVLAERRIASAAVDVSDGLLTDLRRLCRASGVGAEIDVDRIPCSAAVRRAGSGLALTGGEDYELLCAIPRTKRALLARVRSALECPMTRIGVCTATSDEIVLVDAKGETVVPGQEFAHFARPKRKSR